MSLTFEVLAKGGVGGVRCVAICVAGLLTMAPFFFLPGSMMVRGE